MSKTTDHEKQPVLLTEQEAAEWLTVSVPTLRAWRAQRRAPNFVKLGAAVRYRPEELKKFIEENIQTNLQ